MGNSALFYLITDIGSTTTKALLIQNGPDAVVVKGIAQANTTVEAPFNDVRYGVRESILKLQNATGTTLLQNDSNPPDFSLVENVKYLTTSSAGGGLQILVIGLTLFDSASSAKRAAYGAGGIILDGFAMDDKRSAVAQMMAMKNLHPDMILLCGGVDGGATSSLLRMAEILRIAHPLPKFATSQKIPTIYAGNKDMQNLIKSIVSEDFDLVILPNLRPSLTEENLKPSQDMIQKLFMENVMERAPGYPAIKTKVSADILPTPMGVMKSLVSIETSDKRNFFAFDIGGATTDVFSYIKGQFQRTVSANLGMSYSAMNVMTEAGVEAIQKLLPKSYAEDEIRDFIGNKTLYPTYNPKSDRELRIEHALATHAIRLSLIQHHEMNYNRGKIGFLDILKTSDIDAYESKFEYELAEEKLNFHPIEIDVLVGTGGVFAHATNPFQCVKMLINSFDAHGVTELWLDKDFITPHLGVLSTVDSSLAAQMLNSGSLVKLALHIRPHFKEKSDHKPVMQVHYIERGKEQVLTLEPGRFVLFPGNIKRELEIIPQGKALVGLTNDPVKLSTELPIIIDTRRDPSDHIELIDSTLGLYLDDIPQNEPELSYGSPEAINTGEFQKVITLPYKGEITVHEGEQVNPDDVVAINRYNPPRLFVVHAYEHLDHVDEQLIKNTILVHPGDKVDINDNLRHLGERPEKRYIGQNFPSPVRGKIDYIDYSTGTLILSEIQDYSTKPVIVNLSKKLGLPPRKCSRYLKRHVGDFVYAGDTLAIRLESSSGEAPASAKAPSTGQIIAYDEKHAELTIQYNVKPYEYPAHVKGRVKELLSDSSVVIDYAGQKVEGKLGIGSGTHGTFHWVASTEHLFNSGISDSIIGLSFAPSLDDLKTLQQAGIRGLICPGMKQIDLVAFLGYELGVINTGNEHIPFSILILTAFGANRYPPYLEEMLQVQEGRLCHLETHTRIRAGVARPFICFMS